MGVRRWRVSACFSCKLMNGMLTSSGALKVASVILDVRLRQLLRRVPRPVHARRHGFGVEYRMDWLCPAVAHVHAWHRLRSPP